MIYHPCVFHILKKDVYNLMANFLLFQLADSLARENTNVVIIPVDVEHEGICIRFAPLDTAQGEKHSKPLDYWVSVHKGN